MRSPWRSQARKRGQEVIFMSLMIGLPVQFFSSRKYRMFSISADCHFTNKIAHVRKAMALLLVYYSNTQRSADSVSAGIILR